MRRFLIAHFVPIQAYFDTEGLLRNQCQLVNGSLCRARACLAASGLVPFRHDNTVTNRARGSAGVAIA